MTPAPATGTVRFSARVDASAPNPVSAAEDAARARGATLVKLNDSNPTVHGLAPALLPDPYRADPRGPVEARRALATFIGSRDGRIVDPDRIYVLSSTSEAYSWIIKLMCDPGDVVLGPKPGYPLIESIARLECVRSVDYPLVYDGSWTIDMAALAELVDDVERHGGPDGAPGRVGAIVAINPNNPTGSYVKPGERGRLVRLCAEHGIALIADEVFFEYSLEPFDGNARLAGERGCLTFAFDGFSKMLAAPHAKVGWIEVSGPDDVVWQAQRRLDVIADDFLPMGELIASRIPRMLAAVPSQVARVRARTRGNLTTLRRMLDGDPLGVTSVLRPEGGWNVLLRFPSVIDENELVLTLIERRGMTGQPGYFFDMESNGHLAVSLLPEPKAFERGVRAVLDTVADLLA